MKNRIIIVAMLIFSVNIALSQDSIKGRIIDFKTNQILPAYILERKDNKWGWSGFKNENITIADRDGNFVIKVEGNKRNLEIFFVSFYSIKIMNIPSGNLDFHEIKLVRDHLTDHIVIGGPSLPFSEAQLEEDKKLRTEVLEKYRINILGKSFKPYFEEYYSITGKKFIVFDFNKSETE